MPGRPLIGQALVAISPQVVGGDPPQTPGAPGPGAPGGAGGSRGEGPAPGGGAANAPQAPAETGKRWWTKKAAPGQPQPPPNYRPAPGQINKCSDCKYFTGTTGRCDKFQTQVDSNFVCDAWEGRQSQMTFQAPPLPPPPDFSEGGDGEVK